MPSRFWSFPPHASYPIAWGSCHFLADTCSGEAMVGSRALRRYAIIRSQSGMVPTQSLRKYRKHDAALETSIHKKSWSCDMPATEQMSLVQSGRKTNGCRSLQWVEKHSEITRKHLGDRNVCSEDIQGDRLDFALPFHEHPCSPMGSNSMNEESHQGDQRWGIFGHTIDTDINFMCPKGETL